MAGDFLFREWEGQDHWQAACMISRRHSKTVKKANGPWNVTMADCFRVGRCSLHRKIDDALSVPCQCATAAMPLIERAAILRFPPFDVCVELKAVHSIDSLLIETVIP